jgi:thiamine biosynthesis protein ThiS
MMGLFSWKEKTVCDNAPLLTLAVNGRPLRLRARNLADVLEHLELKNAAVVAEVNGHIVPREELAPFPVQDGDVVELARFVGGG